MDMDDIGALCDHPECSIRTYLPFKCEFCTEIFCDEHRSVAAHSCDSHKDRDVHVPSCPSCHAVLQEFIDQIILQKQQEDANSADNKRGQHLQTKMYSIGYNSIFGWSQADDPDFVRRKTNITPEMADLALAMHLANGNCSGEQIGKAKKAKKATLKHRCGMRHCKKKSYILMRCNGCREEFCSSHRHSTDHKCGDPKFLRSKQPKRKPAEEQEPKVTDTDTGLSVEAKQMPASRCSTECTRRATRRVGNLAGRSILVK